MAMCERSWIISILAAGATFTFSKDDSQKRVFPLLKNCPPIVLTWTNLQRFHFNKRCDQQLVLSSKAEVDRTIVLFKKRQIKESVSVDTLEKHKVVVNGIAENQALRKMLDTEQLADALLHCVTALQCREALLRCEVLARWRNDKL